jgi:type I restriction enzyme, S subunit
LKNTVTILTVDFHGNSSIVTKTEALKEQYKNSLQELENLYGSLSQSAFKGGLIVNKNVIKETELVL